MLSPVNKVDDGNRLATSCSNKTNTKLFVSSCYKLVVINSLTTCYVQTIYQTCWNNLLRVCWPHQPCYMMITTCSRLVNNWEQPNRQCEHIFLTNWEIFVRVGAFTRNFQVRLIFFQVVMTSQGWIYWGVGGGSAPPSPGQRECRGGAIFHVKANRMRYSDLSNNMMISEL